MEEICNQVGREGGREGGRRLPVFSALLHDLSFSHPSLPPSLQLPAFLSQARARVLIVLERANAQDISLILNALSRVSANSGGREQGTEGREGGREGGREKEEERANAQDISLILNALSCVSANSGGREHGR